MKAAQGIILGILFAVFLSIDGKAQAGCDFRAEGIPDGDTVYAHVMRVVTPTIAKPHWTRFRLDDVYTPEKGEASWVKARTDLIELAHGSPLDVEILDEKDPHHGFIVNLYRCEKGKRIGPSINQRLRDLGWTKFGKGVPRENTKSPD